MDHFTKPIREGKRLREFPLSSVFGMESRMYAVEQRSGKTQLGFLGHLIERGLGGSQPYMAAGCNHCDLSMKHWAAIDKEKQCNMIQSCIN